MRTNKLIAIVFIAISIMILIVGVQKISAGTCAVTFLGIQIDGPNANGEIEGFVYVVLAILLFAGGAFALRKSRKP